MEVYTFELRGVQSADFKPDYRSIQRSFRGVLLQLTAKMADLPPLVPRDEDCSFTFRVKLKCEPDHKVRSLDWFHVPPDPDLLFGSLLDQSQASVIPVARFKTFIDINVQIERF